MRPDWERAAKLGDWSALQEQIGTGADLDTLDRYGQTALMLAARGGHLESVEVLVRAGADLDVTAKFNLSATMLAVVNRHEEVARVLAAAGANLATMGSQAFFEKTAADLAREQGLVDLARDLAPAGTNP